VSEKIQVVVVDDHPMFREGVIHALGAEPDLDVVGQGSTMEDALSLARDLLPDVMMLDIRMPGSGLRAAEAIAELYPVVKTVIVTASEDDDDVLAAMNAGARGYVLKGVLPQEMAEILRAIQRGEVYVTPGLAAHVLTDLARSTSRLQASTDPMDGLTARERDILKLLAEGQSNKEIGRRLFLTEKTVKHYMTNILQKLQVRNRVEAALLARRSGKGRAA
jgi:DNA-binding NarL/FixJ family response regulator